jgi:hypothetical protein
MDRRLFLVFGGPKATLPPLLVNVRLTLTMAFSVSTSFHLSTSSSPCLMPVWTART